MEDLKMKDSKEAENLKMGWKTKKWDLKTVLKMKEASLKRMISGMMIFETMMTVPEKTTPEEKRILDEKIAIFAQMERSLTLEMRRLFAMMKMKMLHAMTMKMPLAVTMMMMRRVAMRMKMKNVLARRMMKMMMIPAKSWMTP